MMIIYSNYTECVRKRFPRSLGTGQIPTVRRGSTSRETTIKTTSMPKHY